MNTQAANAVVATVAVGGTLLGFIDISEVDAIVKLGGNVTGFTFLIWLLLRVCRERNEAQDRLMKAIDKCASCPLAKAANDKLIHDAKENDERSNDDSGSGRRES